MLKVAHLISVSDLLKIKLIYLISNKCERSEPSEASHRRWAWMLKFVYQKNEINMVYILRFIYTNHKIYY